MSFVVVYLLRAKKFIVIRKNWVQDLMNAKLMNNGRNSNQNFLIFWSANENVANFNVQPNFDAPLSSRYEETVDEICYLGRIIKFFDTCVDAVQYAGKRRPVEPPVYNEAKVLELPLPIIVPLHHEQAPINISSVGNHETEQPLEDGLYVALQNNVEQLQSNGNNSQMNSDDNNADASVLVEEYDEPLMNQPSTSGICSDQPIDPLAMIIKEELEPMHDENIKIAADDLIREEIEFEQLNDDVSIYIDGEIPLPMMNMDLQLKKDDQLSGKLLFLEHNNGDRTYVVQLENGVSKRIFVEKIYVDTMAKWNNVKVGVKSQKYDVRFIRLLLLLSLGMDNLMNGKIDDAVKQWVLAFFKHRVWNNLIRLLEFDQVVSTYLAELKKKKT